MDADAYDALWVCAYCGRRWVVPTLARQCEAKHEAEANEYAAVLGLNLTLDEQLAQFKRTTSGAPVVRRRRE